MSGRKEIKKAKKATLKLSRQGKTRVLFNTMTRVHRDKKKDVKPDFE